MSYSNPAAYQRFMGRWSARLAPSFIRLAGVEDAQRVLDIGCGTGSLSAALLTAGAEIRVVGVDPVPDYVSFAQQVVRHPRAAFQTGAVEALPFPDAQFDAALALLVLQEVADPGRAIGEMVRVTRQGGRIAACQWDFHDGLPMQSIFWDVAELWAPTEVAQRRAHDNAIKRAGLQQLAEHWSRAGLSDVRTTRLELEMQFRSFDDYWQPFLAGATPTSAFAAALSVFSWDIGARWQIETDKARTSEVEVRFVSETPGRTRVELEHRHLDRHGDGWEGVRDGVGGDRGWPLYLQRYAALF